MNRKFYALWRTMTGEQGWAGPCEDIDLVRALVPDGVIATMIAVPLLAMTPAEICEARPILGSS